MEKSRDLDLKRQYRTVRYRRHQRTRRERRGTVFLLGLIAAIVAGLMISLLMSGKPPDPASIMTGRVRPASKLSAPSMKMAPNSQGRP